jgi:hypothetical protein
MTLDAFAHKSHYCLFRARRENLHAASGVVDASNFRADVNANGGITNADISVTKAQVAAGAQLP